jgi:hypothetical protein
MKYLKKFNENKSDDSVIEEVLANTGWKKIEPEENYWDHQLIYQLNNDVRINLIKLKDSKSFNYYLESKDEFNFINSYGDNHTELFSEYNTIYLDLSDYERMMKICKYLLSYFEKKPNDELIEDIRDCFIDIEDKFDGDFKLEWGYKNDKGEWGYFPAFRFSDKLGLYLIYYYEITDEIKEIFEDGKKKLEVLDIHKSRVSLSEIEWGGFVIEITF